MRFCFEAAIRQQSILHSHLLARCLSGGRCRRAGLGLVLLIDRMRERSHVLVVLELR